MQWVQAMFITEALGVFLKLLCLSTREKPAKL